ncbi:MAG: hypothetical protein QNJ41_09865 [Xenococcaceae cyanobacterium MO_188.B32]|nr:hypothetical protein [Xenococcaceae cyanobacterium MO_188.B32]
MIDDLYIDRSSPLNLNYSYPIFRTSSCHMLCSIYFGILAIAKYQSNINFLDFGDRQNLIFGVFTIAN